MGCGQSSAEAKPPVTNGNHPNGNPSAVLDMGASLTSSSSSTAHPSVSVTTKEDVGPMFREILEVADRHQKELGGMRTFRGSTPSIGKKVKREEFKSQYTDYEYVYLTILGIGRLFTLGEEICEKNNGKFFNENPGVQLLERMCGMTMHGDRPGANGLIRMAPYSLLEAFDHAKQSGNYTKFFQGGFDRKADPCLEGRTGRLLEYLEEQRQGKEVATGNIPPWEDMSLNIREDADTEAVVGEYLRVFANECTWRWAQDNKIRYQEAKQLRQQGQANEDSKTRLSVLYNSEAFVAWVRGRGAIVPEGGATTFETMMDDGSWIPFDQHATQLVEKAKAHGAQTCEVTMGTWRYLIDMTSMTQRNLKTNKVRQLRVGRLDKPRKSMVKNEDLQRVLKQLVDLETIPAHPTSPGAVMVETTNGAPAFGGSST